MNVYVISSPHHSTVVVASSEILAKHVYALKRGFNNLAELKIKENISDRDIDAIKLYEIKKEPH